MENRIIVASHNSWSYMPERKKWMRLVRPIARCQDCNITSQYYNGARMFDLRLRWDSKANDFTLAHGIVTYLGRYFSDLLWLDEQAYRSDEDIYIRVLLEDSGKANEFIDERFSEKCRALERRFSYLKFFGGFPARKRWREYLYHFKTKEPSVDEQHVSVSGKWWEFIPKRWAKKNNKRVRIIKEEVETIKSNFLMLDFV